MFLLVLFYMRAVIKLLFHILTEKIFTFWIEIKVFKKNYDFIRVYIYFLRCITRFSFNLLKEVLGTSKTRVFCAYKCASFLHFFSFNHFLKYPILLFSSFQFSLFSRIPCRYICSLLFPPLLIQSRLFIQNGECLM